MFRGLRQISLARNTQRITPQAMGQRALSPCQRKRRAGVVSPLAGTQAEYLPANADTVRASLRKSAAKRRRGWRGFSCPRPRPAIPRGRGRLPMNTGLSSARKSPANIATPIAVAKLEDCNGSIRPGNVRQADKTRARLAAIRRSLEPPPHSKYGTYRRHRSDQPVAQDQFQQDRKRLFELEHKRRSKIDLTQGNRPRLQPRATKDLRLLRLLYGMPSTFAEDPEQAPDHRLRDAKPANDDRNCFELLVKMIAASAITGVRHSNLWRT